MLFNSDDKQVIIFGSPGTGKSFNIQENIKQIGIEDSSVVRLVFHQDFTYSDFIGHILPQITVKRKIKYDFVPGPLTRAIELALTKTTLVCLLIEELNRGHASSIFGDIFQLLDRNEIGNSKYYTSNSIVRDYLDSNPLIKTRLSNMDLGVSDIYLPHNLIIVCTMNNADQNVSPIDTAFKRRFKLVYQPIIFDESNSKLLRLNQISSENIFSGSDNWSVFAQRVNSIIDKINGESVIIPEDKKLAPFFVDEYDVSSRQSFCDKVLYYLKHDVFKYNETYFVEPYEEIYNWFVRDENNILELLPEVDI